MLDGSGDSEHACPFLDHEGKELNISPLSVMLAIVILENKNATFSLFLVC